MHNSSLTCVQYSYISTLENRLKVLERERGLQDHRPDATNTTQEQSSTGQVSAVSYTIFYCVESRN